MLFENKWRRISGLRGSVNVWSLKTMFFFFYIVGIFHKMLLQMGKVTRCLRCTTRTNSVSFSLLVLHWNKILCDCDCHLFFVDSERDTVILLLVLLWQHWLRDMLETLWVIEKRNSDGFISVFE